MIKLDARYFPYIIVGSMIFFAIIGLLLGFKPAH